MFHFFFFLHLSRNMLFLVTEKRTTLPVKARGLGSELNGQCPFVNVNFNVKVNVIQNYVPKIYQFFYSTFLGA